MFALSSDYATSTLNTLGSFALNFQDLISLIIGCVLAIIAISLLISVLKHR